MLILDNEFLIRFLIFLATVVVTFQVTALSRILTSLAWTRLSLGFGAFLVVRAIQLFTRPSDAIILTLSLLGFVLVGWGFHTLRSDLSKVIAMTKIRGVDEKAQK